MKIIFLLIIPLIGLHAAKILRNLAIQAYESMASKNNALQLELKVIKSAIEGMAQPENNTDDKTKLIATIAQSYERRAGASNPLVQVYKLLYDSVKLQVFELELADESPDDLVGALMVLFEKFQEHHQIMTNKTLFTLCMEHFNDTLATNVVSKSLMHALYVAREFLCKTSDEAHQITELFLSVMFKVEYSKNAWRFVQNLERNPNVVRSASAGTCFKLDLQANKWVGSFKYNIAGEDYLMRVQSICTPVHIKDLPFDLINACLAHPHLLPTIIKCITKVRRQILECKSIDALFSLVETYNYEALNEQSIDCPLDEYLRLQHLGERSIHVINPVYHAIFFKQHNKQALYKNWLKVFTPSLRAFVNTYNVKSVECFWFPNFNVYGYCSARLEPLPRFLTIPTGLSLDIHFTLQYLLHRIKIQLQKFIIEVYNRFDVKANKHDHRHLQYRHRLTILTQLFQVTCQDQGPQFSLFAGQLAILTNATIAMHSAIAEHGFWAYMPDYDHDQDINPDQIVVHKQFTRMNVYMLLLEAFADAAPGLLLCLEAVNKCKIAQMKIFKTIHPNADIAHYSTKSGVISCLLVHLYFKVLFKTD